LIDYWGERENGRVKVGKSTIYGIIGDPRR
jgi:hypothetical protein